MTITARSAENAWLEIQHRCRVLQASGGAVATIVEGIPNRITGVFDDRITRDSERARSPSGPGAPARRSQVERTWNELNETGSSPGVRELRFAVALVALLDGVEVDGNRIVLADPQRAGQLFTGDDNVVDAERRRRTGMWDALQREHGSTGAPPEALRELGVYGGAQGIWVDKDRTAHLTEDGLGVTVALLHTGRSYPDDLADDGMVYHYPKTGRPAQRDANEIEATKHAQRLGLPVFTITRPTSSTRLATLSWVDAWDDAAQVFAVTFSTVPPPPAREIDTATADDAAPFSLTEDLPGKKRLAASRPGQHRFKLAVFRRYGPHCAVCSVAVPILLDAAHIYPREKNGCNDARNGLVLCPLHHRAYDAHLWAIEPHTLAINSRPDGHALSELGVSRTSLAHLRRPPHRSALQWRWDHWLDT